MKELVFIKKEAALTTSLKVAEVFEKRHDHVMESIRDVIKLNGGVPKIGETPMFKESTYIHEQNGQKYPMYLMNRDGFALLAMGFTGAKALKFKIAYIEAFDKMESLLAERETDIWQEMRGKTRESNRILTDAIKEALIPLALSQGMDVKKVDKIYMSYMKMINACLGINPNGRDILTSSQLYEADKVMIMSANNIRRFADEGMEYHQIYHEVKAINLEYAAHWLLVG